MFGFQHKLLSMQAYKNMATTNRGGGAGGTGGAIVPPNVKVGGGIAPPKMIVSTFV